MTPEKWQKVKGIFYAALELSADERRAFVENECGDATDLRREIEDLLESFDESENFIEAPAFHAVSEFVENEVEINLIGNKIGAYRILRELGRGGMGAVFLAERADGEFRQQVALKLIKRGMDTDEIVRRFRSERQILANLNHPFIARLVDGGPTAEGLPFLVMDYVEGKPLTEYSAENSLPLNQRLELFLQVCSAVSYAHQNLVVHRDLKPSNILVAPDGSPRLLDFGIAKILADDEAQTTFRPTAGTWQAMTPEYASPEQARGERVTTATDVYSLGVVLYELLTGVRPFTFRNRSQDEINRIITDSEPPKPSDAEMRRRRDTEKIIQDSEQIFTASFARPRIPASQIKGDLDNIVLMAMRKEPERRYSSIEQFAADIRRYLKGLPVRARQDRFGYRALKFVRRNKAGVAAATGIGVSLVAGIVATLRQARIARQERDRALAEARKAERISEFLKKMLASADPRAAGKDVKVVEMLGIAAQSLENEFAAQPEIVADLRTTIGLTYLNLGLFEQAEPHLAAALQTRQKFCGRESAETALSLDNFGQLMQAKGDLKAAEPLFREALDTLRRIHGSKHLDIAAVLGNLGNFFLLTGKNEASAAAHVEELKIRRELLGENHPLVARALGNLGNVRGVLGDWQTAEKLCRQEVAIIRRFHDAEHADAIQAAARLAVTLVRTDPPEAERLWLEILDLRRRVFGEDHPDVAWTLYNLAYLKIERGDFAEAERCTRQILGMREKSLPAEHPVIGSALVVLARSLMAQNLLEQAEVVLRECLDLRRRTLPSDHWLLDTANSFLGECLARSGQINAGLQIMNESYEQLKNKLGGEHEQTVLANKRLNQFQ